MYYGKIIEVFIASPSDVVEERTSVHNIIEEWNIINTQKTKTILKSIRWEKDVYPNFGVSPQAIINNQVLNNADLLIGIFWTRLGTPTEEYQSGTVEEIRRHVDNNKPAMIYFSNAKIEPSALDSEQYKKLNEFKTWCQSKSVYREYNNLNDFIGEVRTHIGLIINNDDYFQQIIPNPVIKKINPVDNDLISFLERLTEFQNDKKSMADFLNSLGDYRMMKLSPRLDELNILKVIPTSGQHNLSLKSGFNKYSKVDIENIIQDIKNGE